MASDNLDAVLEEARSVLYPRDAYAFKQGDEAKFLFVLLRGHLRAEQNTSSGAKVVIRYVSAGDVFGAVEALALKRYPTTVAAVVNSVALAWPSRVWPRLAATYPKLAINILQMIGSLLQDARLRTVEMQTEEVERRLARTLLRLANQAGRKEGRGIEIDFPIRRQDVAELSGATLYTVSRLLSSWERKGLTAGGRQRIVLRDPHRLLGIAEGRRASATSGHR